MGCETGGGGRARTSDVDVLALVHRRNSNSAKVGARFGAVSRRRARRRSEGGGRRFSRHDEVRKVRGREPRKEGRNERVGGKKASF